MKIDSGMSRNPRMQIMSSVGAMNVELWLFYIKRNLDKHVSHYNSEYVSEYSSKYVSEYTSEYL